MMKKRSVLIAKVPTPRFLLAGVHTFEVRAYTERSLDEIADNFPEMNRTLSKIRAKKTREVYYNLVFELSTNPVPLKDFYEYFLDLEKRINCDIKIQRIDFAFDFSMPLSICHRTYFMIMQSVAKYFCLEGLYRTYKPNNLLGNMKVVCSRFGEVTLYDCSDKEYRNGNARLEFRYICKINRFSNERRLLTAIHELRELIRLLPEHISEVETENKSQLEKILSKEKFTRFSDFVTGYKDIILTRDILKYLHSINNSGNFNQWYQKYKSSREKIVFAHNTKVYKLLLLMNEEISNQSSFIVKKK